MRGRGRGGAISITPSQMVYSLNTPLQAFEGAQGATSQISVRCDRSGNFGYSGTVTYQVTGTGANPATVADFGGAFPSGTLNFAGEDAAKDITLTLHGNNAADGDRAFLVSLSNPTTSGGSGVAVLGVGSVICTILDDDGGATAGSTYGGEAATYGGETVTYGGN